jgi:hypothetical protein
LGFTCALRAGHDLPLFLADLFTQPDYPDTDIWHLCHGLDLLLGYTGMPSFGHAAYFGLGAYGAAYIASSDVRAFNLTSNLLVTIPIVIVIVALLRWS